ncbi:MAG: ABC transporter permease, partial [Chloroflexota bacterium]|nr:ABC transporter permease [Chloroflexota bacterium]
MTRYVIRRVLLLIPVLLGVSLLAFMVLHLAPGDAAQFLAGPQATAEDLARIRRQMGLDRPLYVQYLDFLGGVVTGDLGESIQRRQPVTEMLAERYPNTIRLAIASILVAILIGVPSGIISAIRRGSAVDHASLVVSLLGISMPGFWLGLMLILLFAVRLQWLPAAGFAHPWWSWAGIKSMILPAFTLGAGGAALTARVTRSAMVEVLGQDYMRTARSKGLSEGTVIMRHALKNALIPVVTVVGLNFGFLLGGTVIIESVFAINGVGRLAVDAIRGRDYP